MGAKTNQRRRNTVLGKSDLYLVPESTKELTGNSEGTINEMKADKSA